MYSFKDPDSSVQIENLHNLAWQKEQSASVNFGQQPGRVWFKVLLQQPGSSVFRPDSGETPWHASFEPESYLQIDYPQLDRIRVYQEKEGKVKMLFETGDDFRYEHRPGYSTQFLFPLRSWKPLYVQVETIGPTIIPLRQLSEQEVHDYGMRKFLFVGIYMGLGLLLFLTGLALFVFTREFIYLYYGLYVLTSLLFAFLMEGLSYPFFWPELVVWNNLSLPALGPPAFILIGQFAKEYLEIVSSKSLYRYRTITIIQVMIFLAWMSGLILPYYTFTRIINVAYYLMAIALLIVSIRATTERNPNAYFFLTGWSVFLVLSSITTTRYLGITPENVFTRNAVFFGSAFEFITFAAGLAFRVHTLRREREDERQSALDEQRALTESYARFVPADFMGLMDKGSVRELALGDATEARLTVMFADIRSFTSISESLDPEENFRFLNQLLATVGPVVRDNQGFIDKYIGDSIMALFPGRPEDAIDTGIEFKRRLQEFNRIRLGRNLAPIRIGIGINTSDVMLGTIGESERMDGTVIGDGVNLASRLESLTRRYDITMAISEHCLISLEDPGQYNYRLIDRVRAKGKEESVSVIEILDGDPEEELESRLLTRGLLEKAMNDYLDRRFDLAADRFERVLELCPDDAVPSIYLARIKELRSRPPGPDWDGVISMDSK
ncbi:MAG: 7TM diverse intracellular signaling domain-containing protein [Leptospiraceae bacterium]